MLQQLIEGPVTTPAERAEMALPLGKHGGTRSEQAQQGDDITLLSTKRGTDPDYLTARIARDHPDVLEAMKAGTFKSVRAARCAGAGASPGPRVLRGQPARGWR